MISRTRFDGFTADQPPTGGSHARSRTGPGRPDRGCRAQPERVSRHDGQEHEWSSSGPVDGLMDLGVHGGQAAVDAHLMTLDSDGGMPMPRAMAGQEERVRLVDDRT
ncbi:DUF6299 family protein [Streptomyces sp. NPDC051956]|uniref:DUF6299 family protein n=1 Tax=Streptomyces sp. NPDC051956 TaxID=3365677 RepID=UPI0037D77C42